LLIFFCVFKGIEGGKASLTGSICATNRTPALSKTKGFSIALSPRQTERSLTRLRARKKISLLFSATEKTKLIRAKILSIQKYDIKHNFKINFKPSNFRFLPRLPLLTIFYITKTLKTFLEGFLAVFLPVGFFQNLRSQKI